ncbi:hypothetical protein HLH17_13910 [Acinetobacter sp. ANC 5380]|uniref:Uncharacterized protein n=1 Tax=Acinetobacter terrae TaxID=2731247 RepID=A0A7Y2WBV7_9GAMM|nr:hypothetical protein [Acinetobacter terrae]NNH78725.1 hypothetical protein [Acinetobacter terrae]
MLSDLVPYALVFIFTAIPMGLIYWLHCKQKDKKEKQLLSDAKDRKLKKTQMVATGLVALSAVESRALMLPDADCKFFELLMDDSINKTFEDHNEIVNLILQHLTDEQIDDMFDDMKTVCTEIDIFENENMFSDSQDIFNHLNNDMIMNDDFSSFDHSFDDNKL